MILVFIPDKGKIKKNDFITSRLVNIGKEKKDRRKTDKISDKSDLASLWSGSGRTPRSVSLYHDLKTFF